MAAGRGGVEERRQQQGEAARRSGACTWRTAGIAGRSGRWPLLPGRSPSTPPSSACPFSSPSASAQEGGATVDAPLRSGALLAMDSSHVVSLLGIGEDFLVALTSGIAVILLPKPIR